MQPTAALTRRAVLIAGVALPMGACTAVDTGEAEAASPDPDLQLRNAVAHAEQRLIAHYEATAAAHSDLAEALVEFADRHREHLSAVLALAPPDASTAPPTQEGSDAPDIAGDTSEAVKALRDAERDASAARIEDSVGAADYKLAQLLGSVAACEAAHRRLLRRLP